MGQTFWYTEWVKKQIVEIANNLNDGLEAKYITHVPGTCYVVEDLENINDYIEIPSYKEVCADKEKHAEAFKVQYEEQDPIRGKDYSTKAYKQIFGTK